MDRQNFVIFVIFAVFVTTVQNFGVSLNFVAKFHRGFISATLARGVGPSSGKSAYWLLFGSLRCIFYNLQVTHLSLVNCSKVYKYSEHSGVYCVVVNKKRGSEIFSFLIILGQEASPDSYGESWEGKGKFSRNVVQSELVHFYKARENKKNVTLGLVWKYHIVNDLHKG